MVNSSRYIFFSIYVFLFVFSVKAQDIEKIIKSPLIDGNGGLNLTQISNISFDTISSPIPYSYYLSGNLNFNILGVVSVPMSLSYSNNKTVGSISNPFNRLSLSPSYKWIRTHIGYSSMTFSPYTLSGHEFMGVGIELTPDSPFSFSAMYGRLKKSIEPSQDNLSPSYLRRGGGFKVGYSKNNINIVFNVFKAKDDKTSLKFTSQDSMYIAPKENLASGIMINYIINNFNIKFDYGISLINNNTSIHDNNNYGLIKSVLENTNDISVYHALNASALYNTKIGTLGLGYERISPNYNTFGAYYFNNDYEDIKIKMSSQLIKWLIWSANIGVRRDNLEKQKVNTDNKIILSLMTKLQLTKKLQLDANVSNINSYVHIKDIYNKLTQTNKFQNLDTLSFTQINFNSGTRLNYILSSDKIKRSGLNFSFNFQKATKEQDNDKRYIGNEIYNYNLVYNYSLLKKKINTSLYFNLNRNNNENEVTNFYSIGTSLQKTLKQSMRLSFSGVYSFSNNEKENISNIINVRLSGSYKYKKRHNFNMSLSMVNNNSYNWTQLLSANLSYSFSFNFSSSKKNTKY